MFANKKQKWTSLFGLLIVGSLVLSACATPTAEVIEKVVTEIVKEVVKETVIIEGTPQVVEKEVTKIVEKVVTTVVEKVVTATPEPATGGTVVVGLPAGFDRLDPQVTTFARVGYMLMHMTDPLVWQTEPGAFVPGLATEWTVNEDATEYWFKLREDVVFHDGEPLNAEAFKFTYDRAVDPETKSQSAKSALGSFKEIEVLGEYEFVVRFEPGFAPFLNNASGATLAPVSPTAQKRVGNENWGITEFVGTGPFKFESMILNDEIVMVRNDDYNWGPEWLGKTGPSDLNKIIFKFIQEPSTRTAALLTGDIDFYDQVLEIDFISLKDNPDVVTVEIEQPGSGFALMMNQQKSPTDELAVRRALQLAMDKEGIIESVWNGFGTPGCGPLTKVVFCFEPETCNMYTYDLDAARQVLEDDGWVDSDGDGIRERDGVRLTLHHYYRADAGTNNEQAAFIKANMNKVGIEMELHGLSQSGYFDAVRSGQHNTQGWWNTGTDPSIVRNFFHSSNAGGGTNRNNYINEEMDRLIDEGAAAGDPVKRCEIYSQIQKKVKDEAIMHMWNDPVILYAHGKNLSGVTYYGGGNVLYFYAASVSK